MINDYSILMKSDTNNYVDYIWYFPARKLEFPCQYGQSLYNFSTGSVTTDYRFSTLVLYPIEQILKNHKKKAQTESLSNKIAQLRNFEICLNTAWNAFKCIFDHLLCFIGCLLFNVYSSIKSGNFGLKQQLWVNGIGAWLTQCNKQSFRV